MTKPATSVYHEQAVLTASPARLVAKLYETAITALRQAIQAIENNDVEGRWRANRRAGEIIEHLLMTLDHEQGGEIAANLERLYVFMLRSLLRVDLDNDPAAARDVIGLLEPLHHSWCELDRDLAGQQKGASAAEAPGPQPSAPAPCRAATDGDEAAGPPGAEAPGRIYASA